MTTTLQRLGFKLAPPPGDASPERLYSCEDEIERNHDIIPSVVCSVCCLFGIIYCFFGYRCFKAVTFLTGLMFGSVVVFALCHGSWVRARAGVGLGVGALCGLVTMLVRSVGLFMAGLLLGLLLAAAGLLAAEELYRPRTAWVPLGTLLGSGALFALLTLRWPRCFATLSTAVFGAAVITAAVDYAAELLLLARLAYERVATASGAGRRPVCSLSWAVLGAWPTLALLGALVQWKVTAEGYAHTEVIISRQQQRVQLMRISQKEERREGRKKKKKQRRHHHPPHAHPPKPLHPEPAYRRKPKPIRRYDGDVLSPSYIQSFRDRQGGGGHAYPPGRLVSGTHTTVDLDYDCGSTVPLTALASPAVRE
ncbi:hypothetical protein AAFF_G00158610 [Aldrovandia affinis]|uniref:Transmembrane protein 198 n=1 Tax=Aldrovandia affinis TaxID=143900 RepID=A0AAD7W8E0_9TELE|nr:hypothetical protein AAFF_G00158610 [Aldrovandia affinis]